jgi:hypothetical protein
MMKKRILILFQGVLFVVGMLAAQACFIDPGPYRYGYGHPSYGYAHHWHHEDWDHDGR